MVNIANYYTCLAALKLSKRAKCVLKSFQMISVYFASEKPSLSGLTLLTLLRDIKLNLSWLEYKLDRSGNHSPWEVWLHWLLSGGFCGSCSSSDGSSISCQTHINPRPIMLPGISQLSLRKTIHLTGFCKYSWVTSLRLMVSYKEWCERESVDFLYTTPPTLQLNEHRLWLK